MGQWRECAIQDLYPDAAAELQKFISKDEKVLFCYEKMERGLLGGLSWYNARIVTEKQFVVAWFSKGDHSRIQVQSEPLDHIYSFSQGREDGMRGYYVEVGTKKYYFGERKDLADRFRTVLRQAAEEAKTARFKAPTEAKASTNKDIADQLTKLIDLRKNNLIRLYRK